MAPWLSVPLETIRNPHVAVQLIEQFVSGAVSPKSRDLSTQDWLDLDPSARFAARKATGLTNPFPLRPADSSSLVVYLVYVQPQELLFIKLAVGNRGDVGGLAAAGQNQGGLQEPSGAGSR